VRRAFPHGFGPLLLALGGTGCAVGLWRPASLEGQEGARPIPRVDDFRHDGSVGEWRAHPIDRILPATGGIPQALLWIGEVSEGLVVAAEIRSGVEPDERATLAIRLRDARDPALPPIGWGHQFGFEALDDASDCAGLEFGGEDTAACEAWYLRQVDYRAALDPLFGREWRIPISRPDEVEEVGATRAFARLPAYMRAGIAPLAPVGAPRVRSRPIAGTEGGVGMEILIPWSAFPPVQAPDLSALRVAVDWVSPDDRAAAGGATVAAPRPLAAPLHHRVTPCGYGLRGILIPGGDDRISRPASSGAVPYMIPEASGDLRRLIVLDNEAAGYLYEPEPETLSPAAFAPSYEVLDVGRGERVCTPVLAFARAGTGKADGDDAVAPDWTGTGEGDWFGLQVDPKTLDVRRLEDGNLLVKSGPRVVWSYYGSGQCGACPRVGIDVFHIDTRTGLISPALRVLEVAEAGIRDVEIEVSEDWQTVTVFRSLPTAPPDGDGGFDVRWDLTRYCRAPTGDSAAPYEVCGEESDVPEPPLRLRRRYLGEG